jgi:hypothetical protein
MKLTKQEVEKFKAALDEMVEPEPVKEADEWPRVGDVYYFLTPSGFSKTRFDGIHLYGSLKIRGIYRTKAEVELADQRRMARVELVEAIKKANDGWVPGWDGSCFNRCVEYESYFTEGYVLCQQR